MPANETIPIPSSDYEPMIMSNPDGTYTRLLQVPSVPAAPDPNTSTSPVLTKDIPINPTNQTWLRVYLPRQALDSYVTATNKLPLIVYYHGGGFVFLSAASSLTHDFCSLMVEKINAVVISVDYRLAPEDRLPAAYEDAIEALHCIKTSQEDWLNEFADLSNCFLMGTSAGGNIAYHAGLRACEQIQDLYPLKIKGLILHHPYFGGSERTGSELKLVKDPILPLSGNDLMWELSLPVGADREHEYCNPVSGIGSNMCELIRVVGFRVLVTGCYGDPLIDRQVKFAKMLEENGVRMMAHLGEGSHGVELIDPSKAESLFLVVKDFMS
ncbi:carboxylesterase 1 [Ricinus communis]|uniref:Gibberellin receptor GID1, putative n=1 Tax=Ricinus communis TaxID=3988 RepID=B9R9K0_RICCO|nr:carboxylesterase 1 [Ricinus communis]EEF51477.1 Gibberellin receptor GID1, putative [Ricinus communis]|eukprot:XP_002510875.1 carboxylesterase 1 [Ricinus communis]